jgi:hypothetical protein
MEELHQQDQESAAARMEEDGSPGAGAEAMQEDGQQEEEARGQKRRKVDTVKHVPVRAEEPHSNANALVHICMLLGVLTWCASHRAALLVWLTCRLTCWLTCQQGLCVVWQILWTVDRQPDHELCACCRCLGVCGSFKPSALGQS